MFEVGAINKEILSQRMKMDQWLNAKYREMIEEIVGKDAPQMKKFTYHFWAKRLDTAGFHPQEIFNCLKELHDGQLKAPKTTETQT